MATAEAAASAPPGMQVDDGRFLPVYYVYDSYHTPMEEWAMLLKRGTDPHHAARSSTDSALRRHGESDVVCFSLDYWG